MPKALKKQIYTKYQMEQKDIQPFFIPKETGKDLNGESLESGE